MFITRQMKERALDKLLEIAETIKEPDTDDLKYIRKIITLKFHEVLDTLRLDGEPKMRETGDVLRDAADMLQDSCGPFDDDGGVQKRAEDLQEIADFFDPPEDDGEQE